MSDLELLLTGIRTNNPKLFREWHAKVCRHESEDVFFEEGYGYNCLNCHKWSKDGTFKDEPGEYKEEK